MSKIRVLQILRGSGSFGGVASFLISRYRLMNRNEIEFFFLFCQEDCLSDSIYATLIGENRIYELKALKQKNNLKDYNNLYRSMVKFLKRYSFDYVHINTGSLPVTFICLKAAKKVGIENTIAHSHSSNYMNGILNTNKLFIPVKKYLQNSIYEYSKYHFACSRMAAQNMFGKKNYTFVCNSIELKKFDYNPTIRKKIRQKKIVDDCVIYGYVGRLAKSKNIDFVIDIFEKLLSRNKKSLLWIVGDGEEKENIIQNIRMRKLTDYVVMFGNRTDVHELMQAMDIFIFPSLYEGLSLTVIEAQTAGLPVFMSDTLSDEHKITELAHFLSLKENSEFWADYIFRTHIVRKSHIDIIKSKGYDLNDSVKWFEDFYKRNK